VINHTQVSCGIEPIGSLTIIYEDNVACVAQMQSGYVKSNVTKYITPKLFYPHELQVNGDIIIFQIKSCNNLADFFTKSLPYATFSKCVAGIGIGMRRLEDFQDLGKFYQKIICRISITLYSFPYVSFDSKVFSQYILMRQCQCKTKCLFLDFFPHWGFSWKQLYHFILYFLLFFHRVSGVFAQAYSIQIFRFFPLSFLKIVFIYDV
jgi:hypothetical protein